LAERDIRFAAGERKKEVFGDDDTVADSQPAIKDVPAPREAVRAVDNVSFNLHAGETWALVGNPAAVKAPPGGWFWG
jgi:ABC-type glutathione transport system ATPase component